MRGVPNRSDLSFLKLRRVEMLCFASYSIYLHFGEGIIVTIEGEFEHRVFNKNPQKYSFPLESTKLMRLLDQCVEDFDVLADGSLYLEFSNGDRLTIRGKNGPYEAYQIQHAGGQITV